MVKRFTQYGPVADDADIYQYPEHLRDQLADLPRGPGVYEFHGDSDTLPLYIGKSINIRTRVMSHFRTPAEARLLRQTRTIRYTETAGELGALLLEAQLIKTRQPLFNKRLRKNRQLCSLRLQDGATPEVVSAKAVDFAHTPDLFGLYGSRHAALETLRSLADDHQLCYGLLGLESLRAGRPCFRAALQRCAGACCGRESRAAHDARLRTALERVRLVCWPWQGAVGMVEQGPTMTQIHVIHHWLWLGSVSDPQAAQALSRTAASFDQDGYKILCKPLLRGDYPLIYLDKR
ncbi:excinuclease Cho [Pantoea sp. 1.19]|uniref:excinuclease Cho n=1 Tax=Pantoea sp. 1.19 TaxID=1925589 RepID=UPI000948EB9A|nr:excinuclease Cho [Pantoea sp. 1.19]